jgi:alkanesulfonate monooxygenase SsuD/methylene tetrahydromethanopterin reductase-like flavin-dependent oxidoreductase (luciferase family)
VTDDETAARERAAQVFAIYGQLPSYRAMLDREGAEGPADVALVGDEATVRSCVERLVDAGVTDFLAAEFGSTDSERSRTRDLLRSLL